MEPIYYPILFYAEKIRIVAYSAHYFIYKCVCHCLKGLSLEDVLNNVKCRRLAFNHWLSDAAPHQHEEALIVHIEVGEETN